LENLIGVAREMPCMAVIGLAACGSFGAIIICFIHGLYEFALCPTCLFPGKKAHKEPHEIPI
jgi:ascorbate-specific PTS system EIIC-type component UlaA